jgi:hypothetical protein
MTEDLPDTLRDFIRLHIPSFQAAELLVFFAANRDRDFSLEELVVAMRPAIIAISAVREYTALFTERRLLTQTNERFTYGPTPREIESRIGELVSAYHERPVTLITAIYRIADSKIRMFADSFTIGRD